MNSQDYLDCLQFDDDLIFNNKVQAKFGDQLPVSINDWNIDFGSDPESALLKFEDHAFAINGLEEAGFEISMNSDCCIDYLATNLIQRRIQRFRSSSPHSFVPLRLCVGFCLLSPLLEDQ